MSIPYIEFLLDIVSHSHEGQMLKIRWMETFLSANLGQDEFLVLWDDEQLNPFSSSLSAHLSQFRYSFFLCTTDQCYNKHGVAAVIELMMPWVTECLNL